jgi:hypothetical protein
MAKINRTNRQITDQNVLDGIKSNAQVFPLLKVDGKPVAAADAVAILQARIDATNRVAPAKVAWQAAVQAERDEIASSQEFVLSLRQSLQAAFVGEPETLATYGLQRRKTTSVPPQTRVAAAAKAKATRAVRHTMGPKQKQVLKGDVTGVVISPLTASTPSPAAPAGATPPPAEATVAASPQAPSGAAPAATKQG